jgi:hypothetical protein
MQFIQNQESNMSPFQILMLLKGLGNNPTQPTVTPTGNVQLGLNSLFNQRPGVMGNIDIFGR